MLQKLGWAEGEAMTKVLVGVTGSVAAIKLPEIVKKLQEASTKVKDANIYFSDAVKLFA